MNKYDKENATLQNAQENRTVTLKRKVTLRRKQKPVTLKRKVTLRRKGTATTTTADKAKYLLSHLGGELQWTNFAPSVVEYIAHYICDDILTDLQEYSRDGLIDHNYPYDIFDQYGSEMEAYLLNEYDLTDLTPEACMYWIVQLVIEDLIDALEYAQEYTDNSTQVA